MNGLIEKPKAIFMGTPDFAVPCLEATHQHTELVGVFAQPDRKSGRGMKMQSPPVKVTAKKLGIPVFQPESVRNEETLSLIRSLEPKIIVVVAFGKILPKKLLDIPEYGCINVHASILPRWRGASPIQWAIVQGDLKTGVSLMQIDEGMDTGPVFDIKATDIFPHENAAELSARLSVLGASALSENLPKLFSKKINLTPQKDSEATYAPLLRKEDGKVNWSKGALHVHNQIRGLYPWPGTFSSFRGKRVKFHCAKLSSQMKTEESPPGSIVFANENGLAVCCGQSEAILIEELQLEGKPKVSSADFIRGYQCKIGELFS